MRRPGTRISPLRPREGAKRDQAVQAFPGIEGGRTANGEGLEPNGPDPPPTRTPNGRGNGITKSPIRGAHPGVVPVNTLSGIYWKSLGRALFVAHLPQSIQRRSVSKLSAPRQPGERLWLASIWQTLKTQTIV